MELPAAQPLKFIRGLGCRNSFGTPNQRGCVKSALLARIVGEQRALPNPYGQHALLHLAKLKSLHRLRKEPDRMRRQLAVMPNQHAVPVNLVRIANLWHQKRELLRHASSLVQHDRTPVPGHACQARMPLPAPWLVCAQLLPVGAIEPGTGPCKVVSRMKLPRATKRGGSIAQRFNHQRSRRSAFRTCLRRVRAMGSEGKQNDGRDAAYGQIA